MLELYFLTSSFQWKCYLLITITVKYCSFLTQILLYDLRIRYLLNRFKTVLFFFLYFKQNIKGKSTCLNSYKGITFFAVKLK